MLEKKACKKLITEGKREEAKERMKRLNQTTMKEKENALNQLNVLRSQMDTLEQASSVKQLYRMKKLTFDAIPDTGVTLEEVENLVDDVTDKQKDIEEVREKMIGTTTSEGTDDVLRELDQAILNETLPNPPPNPVPEAPILEYGCFLNKHTTTFRSSTVPSRESLRRWWDALPASSNSSRSPLSPPRALYPESPA